MQNKLSKGRLLNEYGELVEAGYGKKLIKDYRRKDICGGIFRIKEWDYYLVYNDSFGVALTLADNSYMGLISTTFFDFDKKEDITKSIMTLFPMGKTRLPSSSLKGKTCLKNRDVEAEFLNDGNIRRLKMRMKEFEKNKEIDIYLELSEEPKDSMVIATPFTEKPTAFYYNQKIIGMKAKGYVSYNGVKINFKPENSRGLLDWGRGVWTYKNTWYWGAAQGQVDGEEFGFNIGYGFGDTSKATENMIFYKGKAHKIDEVTFNIPLNDEGKEDYLKPWTFTSNDNRFEMDFIPILDRSSYTSLGIILSDQHQVFGYFTGKAILDNGEVIYINKFLGFAEKVRNKW